MATTVIQELLTGPLGVPDARPAIDWWFALLRFEGVGALLGTYQRAVAVARACGFFGLEKMQLLFLGQK